MTSTTQEVAIATLSELLRTADGDTVVAMQALLEHTQRKVVVAEKSTVESRKAAYRKMWADYDVEKMIQLDERAKGLIDRIASNDLTKIDGVMTGDQAVATMEEHLESRELTEALDARKELRKAAVFTHIDAVLAAQGIEDPQNHNGEVEVPECGMKFAREAAGYTPATLDEGKLRVVLGEEVWKEISDAEIIPATVQLTLNKTKLLDLANRDPSILDKLSDCLLPGKPKTPRLNVRKL